MKQLIKNKFSTLYFFYRYIGKKLYVVFGFNVLMVFMDSVGLALFVPLLSIADSPVESNPETDKIGYYVRVIFEYIGLSVNVLNMLIVIVLVFILKGAFYYFATKYNAMANMSVMLKMRTALGNGVRDLSYKEFVATDIGRMQNSLLAEVAHVVNGSMQYLDAIKNGVFVFVYLGFAFFMDWRFSLLVLVGGGLTNWIYKFFYTRTQRLSREITKNNHRYGGIVVEVINHFKYLKATGRNNVFFNRLQNELETLASNHIKVVKLSATLASIREPMTIGVICVVIFVHIVVFHSSLSSILIILLFFYRVMQKIIDIQDNWNNYLANTGSIENIITFQSYLDTNKDIFYSGSAHIGEFNEIEMKGIEVLYGDTKVLKGIDLRIQRNQSIAFVGESGSGKTTLVNVISALLPFDAGEFVLNQKDVREYNITEFKSKIGYISQDTTVFNADVFDNITFWSERTDENINKFYEVIDMCSLRPFLEGLENKERTLLGNNGVNISGGQKQRISIARELYRDIEILIMDEATSALDSETENVIKESIEKLKGKITIISIAHRLSTVKNADRLFLMEKGNIIATGNFQELKSRSIYFKRLTELQGM